MGVQPQLERLRQGGLQPQIANAMKHIEGVYRFYLKNPHYVVDFHPGDDWHFSGTGAAPHRTGFAIDAGFNLPVAPADKIKGDIARGLGSKFRVQVESNGKRRFLHIELAAPPQPKTDRRA